MSKGCTLSEVTEKKFLLLSGLGIVVKIKIALACTSYHIRDVTYNYIWKVMTVIKCLRCGKKIES